MSTDYTAGTIGSGVAQQSNINSERSAVQTALERAFNLYGDSTNGDNALHIDMDFNGNDLLNGGTGNFDDIVVGGTSIAAQVAAAAASAAAAATSETNAAASEAAAAASAAAAALSASTIDLPTPVGSTYIRRMDDNTGYELYTISDVVAEMSSETAIFDKIILHYTDTTVDVGAVTKDLEFAVFHDEAEDNYEYAIIHTNNVAGDAGEQAFLRGRGVIGTPTIVSDGDTLGQIHFGGFDGTDFAYAARIEVEVDGTPGSNDMPGRIIFRTSADGSESPSKVLTIGNDGDLTFNRAHQQLVFDVGGQDSGGDEQGFYARNADGGGGTLHKAWIPCDRFNKMAFYFGSAGCTFYDDDGFTSRMAFSSTGDMTAGSGRLWTIQKVDIGGSGTGNIDYTDIGQSAPYYGGFNDIKITAADSPSIMYYDSGGASNEKYWQLHMNSAGTFVLGAWDDALTGENGAIQVERSGSTVGNITFGSPTMIGTDLTMDSGAGGSGSVFGGATGGAQGAGTINCKGLYVDGTISYGVGPGQSWSDVTGSRSAATTYTNSTGQAIMVMVTVTMGRGSGAADSGSAQFLVGGTSYATCSLTSNSASGVELINHSISFIVPSGVTYRVNLSSSGGGSSSIAQWSELS